MVRGAAFLHRLLGALAVKSAGAVLLGGIFAHGLLAATACSPERAPEQARLAKVVDGDTLALADGRRLRLIGVNAPEARGADGRSEHGATAATRFTREFLGAGRIGIVVGSDPVDRYGRTLAHVYREDGRSLEAGLLAAGLALQIVVPPNLGQLDCLYRAERAARDAGAGLWGTAGFGARDISGLERGESGFRMLRGRVTAFSRTRSSWWLEIDDRVSLRIARADQPYFSLAALRALQGQTVEVRGWLVWRDSAQKHGKAHPPWLMSLRHPAALRGPGA